MLQKFAPTCAYWTNNENDFDSSFALRSPPKDFLDWMRSIALLSPHETSHDVSCNVKLCTVLLHVCWIKKCMDASPPPRNATIMTVFPFSQPNASDKHSPKDGYHLNGEQLFDLQQT